MNVSKKHFNQVKNLINGKCGKKIEQQTGKENEDQEHNDLPTQLVIGISVALCGVFLYAIPNPACQKWGMDLMKWGGAICLPIVCDNHDENKKKEKGKRCKKYQISSKPKSLEFLQLATCRMVDV